jgi:hypothetical protein
VTDQDTNDPPDDLTGTTSWSFETAAAPANQPPTVSAGGPYAVEEGGSVQLIASGSDPEGGPLTYAWDLDNNGAYETTGQDRDVLGAAFDGPRRAPSACSVTDDGGATATNTVSVDVTNVRRPRRSTLPRRRPPASLHALADEPARPVGGGHRRGVHLRVRLRGWLWSVRLGLDGLVPDK